MLLWYAHIILKPLLQRLTGVGRYIAL
jgi:hypothetical protein